jgi:hypothetical protein
MYVPKSGEGARFSTELFIIIIMWCEILSGGGGGGGSISSSSCMGGGGGITGILKKFKTNKIE